MCLVLGSGTVFAAMGDNVDHQSIPSVMTKDQTMAMSKDDMILKMKDQMMMMEKMKMNRMMMMMDKEQMAILADSVMKDSKMTVDKNQALNEEHMTTMTKDQLIMTMDNMIMTMNQYQRIMMMDKIMMVMTKDQMATLILDTDKMLMMHSNKMMSGCNKRMNQ